MANSIEVEVRLGLLSALNLISTLRKALEQSLDVKSSSFTSLTRELDSALKSVNRLRTQMSTAFLTSSGSSKFLLEYNKVVDLIDTVINSFATINLDHLKLPEEILTLVKELKTNLLLTESEIKRILSGKIGKIFSNDTIKDFSLVREAAKLLKIDLSKETFDSFALKLSDGAKAASEEVTKLSNKIKNLEELANNATLKKDSVINSITSDSHYAEMTLRRLTLTSAESLRNLLKTIYLGFLGQEVGGLISKTINLNIKAKSNIDSIFSALKDLIEKSSDDLIAEIERKRTAIAEAIATLTAINKLNAVDANGTRYNRESRLAVVDSIKELFKNLNLDFGSDAGKGIHEYLNSVIQTLTDYSKNLNFSEVTNNFKTAITQALLSATTVDTISDTKAFGDKVKALLISIFGLAFDINYALFNGSSITDAFEIIFNTIQNQAQNIDLSGLRELLKSVETALQEYAKASTVVLAAGKEDQAALEGLLKAAENLSATLTKLLQDTLGLASGAIGKGMEEDRKKILQTLSTLENYISSASKIEKTNLSLTNVSSAVGHWMGFYQVLNLTKRAILDMKTHVLELDKVMTLIAVVTNMSLDDLWGLISTYSNIARQYGVAIKGVYEVSLIYYQLGLNQNDTMTLTTETLKMARIAGIDYATAADYMTTAIRGFKLEMSEAAHVTDVFSNLAAHTASDTEELATAISKTASSAEAVGSSFEATSAMIATMVSVTRESATNIGTALKSVISRYGEMTADPSKLVDSEGEEMSLNRVDAALKTIGITILDTKGQFRDFDEVILELADKWDSLDKNSQRYIATLMAGNRQQSRFLALVGNVEEYRKALDLANNSEDTGELLTLKTLDSIDAKIERMKVTIQEFYTSSGILDLYKTILDTITNVIDGANNLPKAFGNIPVWAIALGALIIAVVKNVAQLTIALLLNSLSLLKLGVSTNLSQITQEGANLGRLFGKRWREEAEKEMGLIAALGGNKLEQWFGSNKKRTALTFISTAASAAGAAMNLAATNNYGASTSVEEDRAAGLLTGVGGSIANAISGGILAGLMTGGNPIAIGIGAIANALPSIVSGINMYNVTLSRRLELAEKAETKAKQEATLDKGNVNDLQLAYDKLSQLLSKQYESAEAMAEYHDYMNLLADSYPALISAMEVNGNLIITLESLERTLAQARADAANSTLTAVTAEKTRLELELIAAKKLLANLNNKIFDANLFATLSSSDLMRRLLDDTRFSSSIGGTGISTGSNVIFDNSEMRWSQLPPGLAALLAYNKSIEKGYIKNKSLIDLSLPETISELSEKVAYYENLYQEHILDILSLTNAFLLDLTSIIDLYKAILKNAIENNKDYSYELLTGINDINEKNIDLKLDSLTADELFAAILHTLEIAQSGIDFAANNLKAINQTLSASSADVIVTRRLLANNKSAINNIDLNNYRTFISSMMSRYGSNVNFTETGSLSTANNLYDELVTYIDEHLLLADDLILNLNYSLISSIQELNNFLLSHNFTTEEGINANIIASIQKDYQTSMLSIRTNFYGAIKSYVGQFTEKGRAIDLWQLFDQSNTKDNITGEVASILQSLLPQYLKLLDNGYTTAAETYLNGLIKVYLMVGTFEDKDQTKITDTLRSLDLTDTEAIDSAIEQFTEQGFVELANILQEVRGRIATNLTLTISQMTSEAVDLIGEAEKVIGNVGKGMEYSDALKAAQEIINKSEDKSRIASDSVKFNSDLGQWVLTSDILNESYIQLVEAYNDKLADVDKLLKVAESFVKDSVLDITSKEDINVTAEDFNINWEELTGLTKGTEEYEAAVANEIARFNASLLQLYDQYESGAKDTKWEEYLTKHYEELNLGKTELEAAKKWLQNSAFTALAKLDYSAIITGAASDFDKENFTTYLRMISEELGIQADTLWLNLLDGKFDEFEKATGLTLSDKTKSEALTAKVELYLTAIDELLDDSVTTFSEGTAALLNSKTKQSISPSMINEYAIKFTFQLNSLLEDGKVTLEQYNNAIARAKAKQYGDHSSDILALGEAASMTFESLGSLLTQHGKKLNEELKKSYYKIANGKVQVTDFKAFATDLGIDTNSEDYLTAFKLYNQGLIELDRKTASIIKDEISSIINLKPGERIDVSRLSHELGKNFNQVLVQYGGILNDGILTLSDNANIPGMIQAIIAEVLSSSNEAIQLTSAEVAELLDAVTSYISDIVSLITNGMSGSLTNAQAQLLNSWASQNGVGQVDFIRTNEGIKLTEDAFFNLYGTLSTIDKRMAKKLIPDMTKLSTRYSNLLSVLREYESAQKDSIKRLAMRELASSMLRDPESYNLLGSEMPQTWKIADSFYGNIPKAMQITNKMANTGSVSAEEFSSLMQSIMQSSNKGDALQALEWMQMAPDFFYETADGTLMIDTAAMGIKNLKELNRMWEDAFEEVRLLGDNELKVYNELYYGSESLERADVWKDDGSLDASKLKEIIDSKTQLGNNIKALLDKYKLGNKTLYDRLSDVTDTELRDRIIKKLSTIDWNYDDFESQIAESLEELGLGGKIRFDSDGNYEVVIDQDSSQIDIFYEAEGKTLTKDSYSKWIAAKAKAEMLGDGKVTTEGQTNSINYTIEGQEITVTLDANGNILYKCTIGNDEIAATNESDLRAAIIALAGKGDGDENVEAPEAARTITINGKQYTIVVDAEGKVQLLLEPGTYEILEDGSAELKVVNELLKEQDKQALAAAELVKPTTVEGGDVTITPSAVNIIVDESTPVTIGALIKDKVDVNATNVDVTSTNPPTTDNLNIDNIPYDKQTNVKLSNIITENTSEPDNSKVVISPFTYSDDVQVTLNKINASYTGKPNIDNVKLSDTGLTYSQLLGLVLLNVLLKSEAGKTVFRLGTITLNNNTQLQIADVVNGLLTGTVKLNSGTDGVTVAAGSYVTLKDGSKVDLPEGTIVDGILSKIILKGDGVNAEAGTITLKDGTTVPINEVIGEVKKIIAQWAAGAKKIPDFKNDLNLPTTYDAPPGVITLELLIQYELTDDLKRKLEESYQRIDKQLAGYKIDPGKAGSFDDWALGGKNGKDWKVNLNELGAYVQVLKDLASAGQILSEVELHNLQGLTDYDNLPENISEMALAAINLSNSNSSNLSGAIDNLKLLDTLSGNNLTLVVNSLENLASVATLLQSISWSTIAQGINSLNNLAHPAEAENLGGKEGLTADVTLILLTKGALDDFNRLKQKLVLPKILVLGNTNPLYNAVKNLKLPDKVVNVVYEESNKPAGATGNVLLTNKQSDRREVNAVSGVAAGNVALAGGRGTLMGELGPELYVTNGHYYIAGQSGAEFVDLPEDAIVFNHLLTARLLNNGKTGHGKAVVNERKAVGEAHAFSANKITDQDTSKVDNAVLDAAGEVILAAKATVHAREAEAKKREDNYLASLLNNYVASLKDVKDIINKYATEGKISAEELTKLLDFIKVKVDDVMPKGANFDTKNEIRKAYAETASAVNTVIKSVEAAAAAQRAAALAASDAAKALEDAANQLQQEDKEPTKSQNEYATVQTPRGIVHPGAAPKLKDVFLGNAPSTPTSSSGGSGGSSAGTPRGTGGTLGKNASLIMRKTLQRSSNGASADVEKEVKEAKSAVSNFLSDLLERGIESIDLSKYENLPAELKTEIQGKIDNNTSYRDFVMAYAGALDQSMSEINSTYFLAWQKDLETVGMAEELMEALEGLSMYLDGTIGGQADDWVTLLGDKAFVGDAVEAGVLQWDADLRQYVATSQLAVMDFMNTDLGMVWNFPEVLVDNTLAVIDEINELMLKAISGEGITAKEKSRLEALLEKSNYTGTAEFNQNANGKFGITNASAKEIAASISGSNDTVVDESQKVAQDVLSAIFGAVENSEITREMGNTIEQWLVAQSSSLEEMGIEKTDTGYSIGFDSIIKSIETFGKDNKDQIILLLSGIDVSNLNSTELSQLETTLTAIFGDSAKALIASMKDNLIGRAKDAISLLTKGASEEGISNSEYNELITNFKDLYNIDLTGIFKQTENGYKTSISEIIQQYSAIKDKSAADAKLFLKLIGESIDLENLTTEEVAQYKKALEDALLLGKMSASEAAKLVGTLEDALRARLDKMVETAKKGITGTATSTDINSLKDEAQKTFNLNDNEINSIWKTETTEWGEQLSDATILWFVEALKSIGNFDRAQEILEARNTAIAENAEKAERSTLGAAKIIKDNLKYRQVTKKATISRQAIIDYANAIKQPINEDALKSFEADTEGNITVTMEELEEIFGSAFSPELDALLSDTILELARNEEKEISDAMKDIFSGLNSEDGFSSIDWDQYKETLGPKYEEVKKDAETLSPIEFLNKYIDSFQGTISEINDITTESIKKLELNTRGLYDVFTSSVSWDPYYELFTASGDALNQIFTNQGKELSQEWLDTLERDYKGNYKVSMQDLESLGIVFDKNLFEGYERWLQEQAKAREDQIHSDLSNVISTYIDLGFDAIDFRDYFDLPTETVQLIKESAELSKRDFVVRFAEAAGKTVSEMNLLYFEAWEKDIGLEATEAAKNMLYYFGGGMSGSSTDWQALLGDSVKVSELVRLGLLEYDEALNTYYSKNVEEIEQLTGIDIDDDAITDSIRTAFESIADLIITGLDGALSNTEATKLKANLKHMGLGDVELDFSLGLEGLLLSLASAISLYTLLKKIDAIQANLMFKKLRESLEKSNDKYKTMTSLLKNIYELQEKIDHAERYNPAKIKLFQEELALAKEIAAVRATSEDESFNFLDQDIPAAMNNPLNYTNNWIEAAKSMDEAWKNGKAYDFTRFYNIAHQINDVAKMTGMSLDFLGFTLDGSIDAVDAIIRHGIDKLGTDADMDFGVMFSDWGEGLEMGSQEFANGANNAIHAMALSQIKILDSLIAMFQAIVAMEEFEGADLDMNGILDFDEVFADFELGDEADTYTLLFQDAALKILKMADANKEVQAALELVKVNDVSMMEMLRDTTDGLRNVALTASEYQTAVSVFYEMLKSGDFDINNIALSLRDNLAKNHSNFKGVIETQDMVIDMSYDIAINKTKDGKYKTPGGKEYDTAVEATKAGAVEAAGIDADKVQFDPITKNAYGTIEIADTEVTVTAYGKGKKTWKVDDQEYGSEESAIRAIYDKSSKELSFEAWKIDLEITAPIKVIQDVEASSISKELASHLVGKTFDLIKKEYDDAKGDHVLELEFLARYGFKLDESSTSEDFEKLKEAAGIESKNVEITASVHMAEGSDGGLVSMLESGSATVTVDVVFNKGEDTAAPEAAEIPVSADTTLAEENINAAVLSADNALGTIKVDSDTSKAEGEAQAAANRMDLLKAAITVGVNDYASGPLNAIAEAVNNIPSSKDITITETTVKKEEDSSTSKSSSLAKGNVSGGSMAKGTRTLMGELGPELYVTDGHYYIAGRDGAEFVDLPDDAIVFNHLLTAGLLGKGSAGRGRPITNERNAVSMATGSLGPAAASAKETLAALLQLRAMWLKLADSTIVDLAGVGGSNLSNIAGWVDEVERWYNLLQKIAQLEKDINYQEALRRKIETDRIRDGALYYKTLQDSYDNYIELANAHRELYESQLQYFNQRREELNSEDAPFSKFYTYDENALIKFKDGGYAALADLVKLYDTGELKYTPDEQYNIMLSYGLLQYGQYDSSGKEIKNSDFEDLREYRLAVVKAIWERMDKEREEMQSLHDSIEENKTAYLEALTNGNELLLKVIDNQIQVENDVLAAIESREQAIIDELSELRELLQKETDKYIKGLNDALSKERQLYEKNNEGSELTRLERLLAILRRSGGSASLIRSLESEIDSKRQDQYFSLQEELINAVLEAADAQIQRLDTLIQLMEETLAFEKAHGMLWAEVELIMAGSSNEIVSFLAMYSKDYAALSAVLLQEWIREKLFEADLWTEYRSNAPDTIAEGILKGSEPVAEERYDPEEFSMEKLETDEKNPAAGSSSSSGSSHSGGYSGGGGYSTPAKQEFDWKDYNRQSKRYDETEESKNIALGVMNQYKNNPYSLDYLDAHTAYLYYDKESKLAQSNMQRIKKGDKDYTPDYDESKTDAIILPSSDSGIRATSEAINTIKSNIETNNNTITQANAQIEAYKKAGLAEDSTEILSIKSNIKKLEEANKAGEALIKERLGWINAALGYKKGGIIDYTGLAIVHGSKEEPEAVLNSKDYKLWKQSIGSNVWESLERERLEMQALHDTFNSVITNSSESSIVIEKAEVNVNVEQIANDYDAKRMGELTLQEMVRIARKTGTATIRR